MYATAPVAVSSLLPGLPLWRTVTVIGVFVVQETTCVTAGLRLNVVRPSASLTSTREETSTATTSPLLSPLIRPLLSSQITTAIPQCHESSLFYHNIQGSCFQRWSTEEVSAFGEEGEGDHLDEWTVQCGGSVWKREEAVRFRHRATDALLSVTGEQYGRPIQGQREVHAMSSPSQHSLWKAMEGVFMKPSDTVAFREHIHTEF
uniref:Stromal cell-derived factor 2 n=1 Tax=Neogobius melanostomus TaxID=47308 RepID=A0A8C6WMA4_9GOBI